MSESCRLCRKSCEVFLESIFEYREGQQISEVAMKVCPIQIDINDLLPKFICDECLETVLSAHELQRKSLESENFFKSYLSAKSENIPRLKIEKLDSDEVFFEDERESEQEEIEDTSERPDINRSQHQKIIFKLEPLGKRVSKTKLYPCNFCDIKPRTAVSMVLHMQRDHNPQILPKRHSSNEKSSEIVCEFCGVTGISQDGMNRHKALDHNQTEDWSETLKLVKDPRFFGYIKKEFAKKVELVELKNFLVCDLCGNTEDNLNEMETHMNHHLKTSRKSKRKGKEENSIKCKECGENFKDKLRLRYHSMEVHENLFRKLSEQEVHQEFKCCACEIDFDTEKELTKHVESHRDGFTPMKCSHSPKPLNSFQSFMKHIKYQAKPRTHECLKCKKVFSYGTKLFEHSRGHNRQYAKFSCEKCSSKFKNKLELENHDKVKHQNQTLFICPICAKSLGSASSVSSHIKNIHNKDHLKKEHSCKICERSFRHKSHLTKHEATHRTERPHVCELCAASFKTKDGLVIHMKRHAGTLVRFKCNQCEFKCPSQHRLNVHLLTHSGAKPHECEYCDRAYASKGDLVKHLQKVHVGNAVYKCEKCPEAFRRIVELREHQVVHADLK